MKVHLLVQLHYYPVTRPLQVGIESQGGAYTIKWVECGPGVAKEEHVTNSTAVAKIVGKPGSVAVAKEDNKAMYTPVTKMMKARV